MSLADILHTARKHVLKPQFIIYFIVGLIALVVSTFLLWVLVDKLHLSAGFSNIFISGILFFAKFFSYNSTKMFDTSRNKRNFIHYCWISAFVVALSSILLWIFVDIIGFSVLILNPLVVIFGFLVRYLLFMKFKLVNEL